MAYNILPSTETEARKAVSFMNKTSADEALRLWNCLLYTSDAADE